MTVRRFFVGCVLLAGLLLGPWCVAPAYTDEVSADEAAAEEGGGDEESGGGTVELMGEGGDEEEEEEPADPEPAPPPKPKPKPKPAPRPAPKPVLPASPFDYLPIEDFEKGEPGVLRRAGPDPKPQFSARVAAGGADGSAKALVLSAVPAAADGTAWFLTLPRPLDLRAWRGISVKVKASKPSTELRIGVVGGGTVFTSALIGMDWTEIHLDMKLDPGRGRFDSAAVTEIALTCAHELQEPVDVTVDSIAGWRDRVPAGGPARLGMNAVTVPGPYEWRIATESVNCAARGSAADGLSVRFWSAPLPYGRWAHAVTFRELPRGLAGTAAITAVSAIEPAQPGALLKFTLIEEGGERFAAVRPAGGALRIPLAEFVPDALELLRRPAAAADGRLDPAAVCAWALEILPATERQIQGTVTLRDLQAESGTAAPAPRPAPRPVARPKPAPKPVAAPEPEPPAESEEEDAPEDGEPQEGGDPDDMELN